LKKIEHSLVILIYEKWIFLAFFLAKVVTFLLNQLFSAISCSIDRVDNPTSLSWVIVDRRYVLISLSLEKLRSPLATDTGSVRNIFIAVTKLGKQSRSPFGSFDHKKNTLYTGVDNPGQVRCPSRVHSLIHPDWVNFRL